MQAVAVAMLDYNAVQEYWGTFEQALMDTEKPTVTQISEQAHLL